MGKICHGHAGLRQLRYVRVLFFPNTRPRPSASTISTVRHLTALLLADLQHRVDPRSEEANRPTERYAISRVLQIREAAQFDERVAERSVSSPRTLPTRPQSGATSSQQPRSCRRRSYTRPRRGCGSRLGLYPPASPGKLVLCRSPPCLRFAKSRFARSSARRSNAVKNAVKLSSSFRTRSSAGKNNYNSSLPIKPSSP